ncbi:hypothetical protein [Rhizobium redzepovicii]|uniref:hypothetical protein n=1 Tax=Rhizobium redzepovicii TaxID=2867518 RepID=UPI002871FC6B|nr:hypothetical protein [Rhizobium redzepovicii]MDR9784663.1 hypothetical protein [Rhizobium redzepovicii]
MRVVINSSSRRLSVGARTGLIAISTIDTEPSLVDVAGIFCWMGQNATPFLRRLDNAARQKKFLPFRNFFIKAALVGHWSQ